MCASAASCKGEEHYTRMKMRNSISLLLPLQAEYPQMASGPCAGGKLDAQSKRMLPSLAALDPIATHSARRIDQLGENGLPQRTGLMSVL